MLYYISYTSNRKDLRIEETHYEIPLIKSLKALGEFSFICKTLLSRYDLIYVIMEKEFNSALHKNDVCMTLQPIFMKYA